MSVLGKIWKVKNEDSGASLFQKLLQNRGLTDEEKIHRFLYPQREHDFHDPYLMKDMARAVERIGRAIEKNERVMIFGDYDVDGITGTAILMRALKLLGCSVSYRLPHRIEDGYGLREKFVREFKKLNVKVAITVDNGISCAKEADLARGLGIDLIISDHHTMPAKIPDAYAILHPKLPGDTYPFHELTGAGVALKLAQALFIKRLGLERAEEETQKLLDLACMGTVGDLGLLYGENRYIVKEGLRVLKDTRWPGLSRLKQSAGVNGKVDTYAIGFMLGPRLNAAGRISHASHALKLLLHDGEHTTMLAQILEQLNKKRQSMVEKLMEIAEEQAAAQANDPAIILHHKSFHGGVIGLLAARMQEKYGKPAIVMEDRGEILVGSCRSIPEINIAEALTETSKLLTHFGGHAMAAGFEIEKKNLGAFTDAIKNYVAARRISAPEQVPLNIDCELMPEDISLKTVEIIENFEPFGAGNETPRFLLKNLAVMSATTVGAAKKHLKIMASANGKTIECIAFKFGAYIGEMKNTKKFNAVCEIERNEWNGTSRVQLKLVDFKMA